METSTPASPVPVDRRAPSFKRSFATHAWRVYLALGLMVAGSFFVLPSPAVQNVVGTIISLCTAIAVVVGTRLHRPLHARPWYLLAVGVLLACSGDALWTVYENVWHADAPFPSWVDAIYLSSYVMYICGLLQLVRIRTHGRDWSNLIDALIIAVGLGMMAWVFLMVPYVYDPSLSLLERLVSIAYPLLDVVLVAVVARLLLAPGSFPPAYVFLLWGLVYWLVGDAVYGVLTAQGLYYTGIGMETAWWLGSICIAVAALHPSMRTLGEPGPFQRAKLTVWRLLLLAAAALLAPATLVIEAWRGEAIDVPMIAGGSVVLFVLVIARMSGLMRALAGALEHLETLVTRERSLRKAGVALVAATDRAGLYTAAVEGAWALANNHPATRATLTLGTPGNMTVVAAAGAQTHVRVGQQIAPQFFQSALRDALQQKRSVRLDDLDQHQLHQTLGIRSALRSVCITPLLVQDDVRGMLVLASDVDLPHDCQYALEALGIDVALALESMALAEAVHQRQSDARLAALVQYASDVLFVLDSAGTIRYVSASVTRILGYTPGELIDTARPDMVHPDDLALVQRRMAAIVSTNGAVLPLEVRMRHNNGHWVCMETIASNLLAMPHVQGILLTCRDITERKAFQERLTHQAFHDALTNLPNRALFADRLGHALARAVRQQRAVAVLFLDLDRFKTINDSLGHEAGDQLLLAVTERLQACVRLEDTLSRLGGDEFTILLEDIQHVEQATDMAARILMALRDAFCIQGHEVVVSASIGIILSSSEHAEPTDLLRYADIAMYQAKHAGKARYVVFDQNMNAAAVDRLELEHDLRRAIERNEVQVYYQPIVDLATAQIVGLEALARWQHPQRGFIAPVQFIPLAEETGLIVPLGRCILEQACRQAQTWLAQHPQAQAWELSVNLSARQFRLPTLVEDIAHVLAETHLPPACLKLEITESVVMEAAEVAAITLHELKALGVHLAIDDFGTGYSSLSYLKRFPVDTLKIDRAFIAGLGLNPEDTAIVRAVTTLADSLGLSVVAEGVETAHGVAHLQELGCAFAQGYFFAKPLPATEVTPLLEVGTLETSAPSPIMA